MVLTVAPARRNASAFSSSVVQMSMRPSVQPEKLSKPSSLAAVSTGCTSRLADARAGDGLELQGPPGARRNGHVVAVPSVQQPYRLFGVAGHHASGEGRPGAVAAGIPDRRAPLEE